MLMSVSPVKAQSMIPVLKSMVLNPGESWSVIIPADQFYINITQSINPEYFTKVYMTIGAGKYVSVVQGYSYTFSGNDHNFVASNHGYYPATVYLSWETLVVSTIFMPLVSH
jgi:hypothetical protein